MRPSQAKELLKKCVLARYSVLLTGAPGVGKTQIVMQVAKELDAVVILSHPVLCDPTDPKGLPAIVNGKAEFLPFGQLRQAMQAKGLTVWVLDDLGQAASVVQASFMQLIHGGEVNGKKISDNVVFIACTNRREDLAGVTHVLEPVKSRFHTIVEITPHEQDFVDWAMDNDIEPDIIGLVHFRPDILTEGKASRDIVNHCCPRTLEHASDLIKLGFDDIETLSGAVGEGAANEIVGFRRFSKDLPNIGAILVDPINTPVPTEPSAQYAVAAALVYKIDESNANNIMTYARRLPAEAGAYLFRDCIRKNPQLANNAQYIAWVAENDELLV